MKHLLTILFLIIGNIVFSQEQALHTNSSKAQRLYESAQKEASRRNYSAAQKLLASAIKKDNEFAEAQYLMGVMMNSYGERDSASYYFKRVLEIAPGEKKFERAAYFTAENYFEHGSYNKAIEYFQAYIKYLPDDDKLFEDAKTKIENCHFALDASSKNLSIHPQRLPEIINRFQYQYFPVLTADEEYIFFTARDDVSTEDIFVSRFYNGEWVQPQSISSNINSPAFNEGTCTVSGDGRILVFTSCNSPGGRGRCDLYISYREGNKWSKPANMGVNVNSKYWDSQPALSADGRTIYFSSDRPGGVGRMDIWYSERDAEGRWKPALNLNRPINTPGDEFSPFIHPGNKAFYFASSGHKGFGGLDLFYSVRESDSWQTPENLGMPINTWQDEVAFFVSSDGKNAYYSTNEMESGKARSFLYKLLLPPNLQLKDKSYSLKGIIYDKETNKKLKANIDLVELEHDQVVQSVKSDPETGEYLIVLTEGADYGLFVSKKGYLFESLNFDLNESDNERSIILDIYLTPIAPNAKTVLNNIFFDFAKSTLRESSKAELEKIIEFMNMNPEVKIEISGHTDDVGSEVDNLKLSNDRAKSVRDFLLKQGIADQRLEFKGYGESKPRVENSSESNQQLNRRIEFTVVSN